MSGLITFILLYCPTNPRRTNDSDIFERLGKNPRFMLIQNGCYGLCSDYPPDRETPDCRKEFFAQLRPYRIDKHGSINCMWQEGDTVVRGKTEREFLDDLVRQTGLELGAFYKRE